MNSISGVTSTKGNAIIMSTREEGVASKVTPHHVHSLIGLSDQDCWSIIKAKAFQNGEASSPGFEVIGREIAKRCQGLPLAANVFGGVLRGCKTEEEWRFVKENRLSDIKGGEIISEILKLSYHHLASPSRKKCFAYCSIFPKGREIMKQEVIEMWMAEGFLHPNGRNDMESVGNEHFNVLVHNSLLLVSKRDDYGNVSSCVMHDLVHDVASSVLGSSDGSTLLRYMVRDGSSPIPKEVAKHLRTLVLEGYIPDTRVFSDVESLHVLTIKAYGVKKLPSSIRKLIHLRQLDISSTGIKELPEWIDELHHLHTLRTPRLEKLQPSTLEYMTNLNRLHVDFSSMELPAEIGKLPGLQILEEFKVGDEKGYRIEELGSLNNLRGKLEIRNLEKVGGKEEAERANMFQKPNLLDLSFQWSYYREGERNDESVLEGLQPHPNLNKLWITRFMGKRFPAWAMKMAVGDGPQGSWKPLDKLINLTLWECHECEDIPMLGHLPNLKSLKLVGLKKVRFINSPFSELTSLRIDGLEGLECLPDWLFYNNPNLSELEIYHCPKLRELPDGLHTLTSLEKLEFWDCPNLKSIGSGEGEGGGESKPGILAKLWIMDCRKLKELPSRMVELWAPSVESVTLHELSSLENLSIIIDCLAKSSTRLSKLSILGVPNFMATTGTSDKSWPLPNLQELGIGFCKDWSRESIDGIEEKVDGVLQSCSSSLTKLELKGMDDWECLPQSIQPLTALYELKLENFGMEELSEWLGRLPSLQRLILTSCSKLRRLPAPSRHAFTQLRYLRIKDCPLLHAASEWQYNPDHLIHVDDNWYKNEYEKSLKKHAKG